MALITSDCAAIPVEIPNCSCKLMLFTAAVWFANANMIKRYKEELDTKSAEGKDPERCSWLAARLTPYGAGAPHHGLDCPPTRWP